MRVDSARRSRCRSGAALSSPAASQMRAFALLAVAVHTVTAAPAQFEVKSLPGWEGPLLSKAYCGFSHAGVPPSGEGNSTRPRSVTQLSHVRARILLSHATERCCIRAVFFNYIFLESENDPKNDPVIIWCVLLPKAASRRPRALADCRRLVSGHTAGTTAALAPRPCSASSSSWARTTSTRTASMIPSTTRPASRRCSAIRTAGRRSPTWCVPMVVSSQSLDG
jgi:hypothetical protein